MINEEVTKNFHAMGVLLMLDAPSGLEFGIDNISWKIGSKFKGVKLIPLGTHVISYSLESQNHMFPTHKFIFFGKQLHERIHVYRWCTVNEKFIEVKGEQADGYREGVRKYHFDCYLGPYPNENVQFWYQNTRFINQSVLSKLDPIEYYIDPAEQYKAKKKKEEERIEIDEEDDDVQIIEESNAEQPEVHDEKEGNQNFGKVKDFGGNIYYSEIPRRLKKEGEHTSNINIDKSQILEKVLKKQWSKNEINILGELQYSFVSFLIGQNLDSYNQWKHLLILLVNSQKAFKTKKQLMLDFIIVLYEQFQQFPEDFFRDQISKQNFLCGCLLRLKNYTTENQIGKKAISRINKVFEMLWKKFQYQVEGDEEEEPILVDENENYF